MTLILSLLISMQVSKKIPYEVDGSKLEGVLIYEDTVHAKPGLLLVPNWMGITEANLKQAKEVAGRGYTVFVADVFGVDARPKTLEQAGAMSGALKNDRPKLRARTLKALEVLRSQKGAFMDARNIGAIGFCFGGTAALELARAGADIQGVVTFHAGLSSPTPTAAIKPRIMALHGADDPFVPAAEVQAFEEEMRNAKADWQLIAYGNAVHSFTDVDASTPGKSMYNPVVSRRAYASMDTFFHDTFAVKR